MVQDTLLQIFVLFENTAKISVKYETDKSSAQDYSVFQVEDMDLAHGLVQSKLTQLATHRRRGASLVKRAAWTLHGSAELAKLIDGIISLVESLERITMPLAATTPLQLAKAEVAQFQDRSSLAILDNAADQVDPLLQACARLAFGGGHRYFDIVVKDQAKALTGDSFSDDWKLGPAGLSHLYRGVQAEGNSRVQLGNTYGGKSIFED